MDRIVRMGRMKKEEPDVKYKTGMSDSTCFAHLHLIACILWQSINPSLVFLIRKRLHALLVCTIKSDCHKSTRHCLTDLLHNYSHIHTHTWIYWPKRWESFIYKMPHRRKINEKDRYISPLLLGFSWRKFHKLYDISDGPDMTLFV